MTVAVWNKYPKTGMRVGRVFIRPSSMSIARDINFIDIIMTEPRIRFHCDGESLNSPTPMIIVRQTVVTKKARLVVERELSPAMCANSNGDDSFLKPVILPSIEH